MAISRASGVSEAHGRAARRDGIPDRSRRARMGRDRLQVSPKARQAIDLTPDGVTVGEPMPVKVRKGAFTVRGTAVVTRLDETESCFEIHIRDKVWGKKIEKDVTVSIQRTDEGGYRVDKTEADSGKHEGGDVSKVEVKGDTTVLHVPDQKRGGDTQIQFTDYRNGRFRIRGEDFTADFNA